MYKSATLKPSVFYHASKSSINGYNLEVWLYKKLINLGVIVNGAPCCVYNNLFLKNDIAVTRQINGKLFNLDNHIYELLSRLNVTVNTYCCPAKDKLQIRNSDVYFIDDNISGLSLIQWLKQRLEYYNITFVDPCC